MHVAMLPFVNLISQSATAKLSTTICQTPLLTRCVHTLKSITHRYTDTQKHRYKVSSCQFFMCMYLCM